MRTDDFPSKCGFIPIASPLCFTCSHSCSPDGGAHFRYWPACALIVSARSATRLASAARSSPDETVNPIAENWLGNESLQPERVDAGRHDDDVLFAVRRHVSHRRRVAFGFEASFPQHLPCA